MLLFINGCVREQSRTLDLAKTVLSVETDEIQEIRLYPDGAEGLNAETLRLREECLARRDDSHPLLAAAKQFTQADAIVIAAPYWDLLFPAKVRAYLEEITVSGLTFRYTPEGRPQGLCKASRLIYVTTAGGPIFRHFGFEYVEALAHTFYGIPDVRLVKAEGLDIQGADAEAILRRAKDEYLASFPAHT